MFLSTLWLTLVSCRASSALPTSPGAEALGCCNFGGHRGDLRVFWTCGVGILALPKYLWLSDTSSAEGIGWMITNEKDLISLGLQKNMRSLAPLSVVTHVKRLIVPGLSNTSVTVLWVTLAWSHQILGYSELSSFPWLQEHSLGLGYSPGRSNQQFRAAVSVAWSKARCVQKPRSKASIVVLLS